MCTDEHRVPPEVASIHAATAFCEQSVYEPPSLVDDVEPALPWFECLLGEPLPVYDINGTLAVYAFSVLDIHHNTQGRIIVAADARLGSTVLSVQRYAAEWHAEEAMRLACNLAVNHYPGWNLRRVVPVVHDIPAIGMMAEVEDPSSGDRQRLIVDIDTGMPLPVLELRTPVEQTMHWSTYPASSVLEVIDDHNAEPLIRRWHMEDEWTRELFEQLTDGDERREDLHRYQLCGWKDSEAIERIVRANTDCEIHTAPVRAHYMMSMAGYCTAAAARMIGSRYGVYDSEGYVASVMGIPYSVPPPPKIKSKDWATANDELKYYKNDLHKMGSKVHSDYAYLSKPANYKKELTDKGKGPANLRKFGIDSLHHSRVFAGIRICKTSLGDKVQLGLLSTTSVMSPMVKPQNWDKFDDTPLSGNGVVSTNLQIGGLVVVRD